MSFNLGNTNIEDIYVGSTKIAQAYVGSTLVFQISQPPAGYDSYRIKLEWVDHEQHMMAIQGVNINGTAATSSQFSGCSYYAWGSWITGNPNAYIDWNNFSVAQFEILYLDIIEPNVTSIGVHTGTFWSGDQFSATVSLIGVKDSVETVLGTDTKMNGNDLTYSVSI